MAHELDTRDTDSYKRGEKRSMESDEGTSISLATKRVNYSSDDDAFLKFLVPSVVPGIIIGSAGATIAEIMDTTQTNIKFSSGRELYPGTNERVCCIVGPITNICDAVREIFSRMNDPSHTRYEELQGMLGRFRMLVSNIAAGMIIGKSGQTIKSLQQDNGVKIQISKKDDASLLPERILTISGSETEPTLKALHQIVDLTRNDPDVNKWKKLLSYNNYSSKVPSTSTASTVMSGASHAHAGFGMQQMQARQSMGAAGTDYSSSGFLSVLQHPAYAAFAGSSMAQAAQAQAAQAQAAQAQAQVQANAGTSFNMAMLSYTYAQSLMTNSSYLGHVNPVMVDGVNLMIPGATLCTYEIAIPEIMISIVIGHGGKLLSDLMQSTGTRIQLSGKGEYIPGTYNRKLTIIGPILSVQAAHMVLLQKIMKEQETYRKQGLV